MRKGAIALLTMFAASFGAFAQSPKIGVFDPDAVFQETIAGKRAQQEMQAFYDGKREGLTARESELQEMQRDFISKSLALSEERKAEMNRQLEERRIDLRRMQEDAEREMKRKMNAVQADFARTLQEVIESLGREEGFALILDSSLIVYYSDAVDITDQVVAKYDSWSQGQ